MKLDECYQKQGKRDQETKRGREVLPKEKSTQTKHPSLSTITRNSRAVCASRIFRDMRTTRSDMPASSPLTEP